MNDGEVSSMPATFERGGFRLAYPENWQIEESPLEHGWTVALQSPGQSTAFMTVSVQEDRPSVTEVLESTLAALREDYPDLEADAATERIAGHQARGYDIQFFSLDLVNTCWLRSFRTPRCTVLILSQANDLELEFAEPVLHAIRASIELVDGK